MLIQQGHDIEQAHHLLRREAAAAESNRTSTPRGSSEAERDSGDRRLDRIEIETQSCAQPSDAAR